MRTLTAFLSAVLTVGTVTGSVQQPLPNLSGTWVATKDTPATVAAAPSAVFGERFGLRAEGKNMALIRPIRGRATALTNVFPVDGTETAVYSFSRPCIGQSGQLVSMAWRGDVLRYSILGTFAPGATTPTRSTTGFGYGFRSISADKLVVETTMRDAASGEIRAVGTVYQRSTEALPEDPPSGPKAPPVAPARIAQVEWIAGDWINVTATGSVEERWSTGNGGGMIATSRTLRGDVMTAFEFLNPTHDFPKMIRYSKRADGGLDATISGGPTSKPTTFSFKRNQ